MLFSTPGLSAFAQDDGQIAWWSGGRCPALHIRTIATSAETRIPPGRSCLLEEFDGYPALGLRAFAGGRALWSVQTQGNYEHEYFQTASVDDPHPRNLSDELYVDEEGDGSRLQGMAGDGATLVYWAAGVNRGTSVCCAPTRRLGLPAVGVPEAPGAFAVAVSGRLAAFLRPAGLDDAKRSFSDESTPVEVRDVQTGELLGHFKHGGRATAVALAPGLVALLVHEESSTRIETYSVDDGHRQAEASVPSTATDLSIAGETVVFRSGNTIYVLNARSGRESKVAVAKGIPIGLSIEGRRIAWGEKGRILALYLSAR